MSVVMKLWGLPNGARTPYDGQFLKDFDFNANGGQGLAALERDIQFAKRFPTMADAILFRNRVPASKPLRHDLQPNRPLMATNWEFIEVDDG